MPELLCKTGPSLCNSYEWSVKTSQHAPGPLLPKESVQETGPVTRLSTKETWPVYWGQAKGSHSSKLLLLEQDEAAARRSRHQAGSAGNAAERGMLEYEKGARFIVLCSPTASTS